VTAATLTAALEPVLALLRSSGDDPWLVVLAGTTGSGKTTIADGLAGERDWLRLESDVMRKLLAGLPPNRRADGDDLLGGIYSAESTAAAYAAMLHAASLALVDGRSVLLDGSFRDRATRARARGIGRAAGVPVALLVCHAPRVVQLRRLEERYSALTSTSDGRAAVLALHESDWQDVDPVEADHVLHIDTAGDDRG
jgi:predicted kinase